MSLLSHFILYFLNTLKLNDAMDFLKLLFWGSILLLVYVYVGYPLIIFLFSTLKEKKVKKGSYEPKITILISAYNEEKNIEETIRNKLNLNYPRGKIEILVVSDGSTDRTEDIVRKYESQGIKLLRQNPRSGKTTALNMAVPKASGEILVFSDANSMYDADAIKMLMKNFVDTSVGYVTGKMIYSNPDGTAIGDGCTIYMRYENILREIETKVGSIVGVDGGVDAVRKQLYQPMNPDQLPDFVLPIKVVEKGYRVVYEPGAVLRETSLNRTQDEYRMRVRVSLRSLWALWDMRQILSFKKFKFFAWQLWSHKALRYFCFLFLIGAYLSNMALWPEGGFYQAFFLVQNGAYLGAVVALILERGGLKSGVFYILSYFVLLNLASAQAFMKFILGQKQVIWAPRQG